MIYTTAQIHKAPEQVQISMQLSREVQLDLAYILHSSELLCDHGIDEKLMAP
jgi:hypothetical protein